MADDNSRNTDVSRRGFLQTTGAAVTETVAKGDSNFSNSETAESPGASLQAVNVSQAFLQERKLPPFRMRLDEGMPFETVMSHFRRFQRLATDFLSDSLKPSLLINWAHQQHAHVENALPVYARQIGEEWYGYQRQLQRDWATLLEDATHGPTIKAMSREFAEKRAQWRREIVLTILDVALEIERGKLSRLASKEISWKDLNPENEPWSWSLKCDAREALDVLKKRENLLNGPMNAEEAEEDIRSSIVYLQRRNDPGLSSYPDRFNSKQREYFDRISKAYKVPLDIIHMIDGWANRNEYGFAYDDRGSEGLFNQHYARLDSALCDLFPKYRDQAERKQFNDEHKRNSSILTFGDKEGAKIFKAILLQEANSNPNKSVDAAQIKTAQPMASVGKATALLATERRTTAPSPLLQPEPRRLFSPGENAADGSRLPEVLSSVPVEGQKMAQLQPASQAEDLQVSATPVNGSPTASTLTKSTPDSYPPQRERLAEAYWQNRVRELEVQLKEA